MLKIERGRTGGRACGCWVRVPVFGGCVLLAWLSWDGVIAALRKSVSVEKRSESVASAHHA